MSNDNSEFKIPVFDGENSKTWKKRITMFLKMKKCDEVITRAKTAGDEEPWDSNDLKAINYIYSSISDRQMEFIGDYTTAFEIIKKFDSLYLKESTALQIVCRNKLEKLKFKNYCNCATFFDDFEKYINELKSAGASVTEKEKLSYVLNTLPESYSYIDDLIDTLKEEGQTANYVKNKIQLAEMKSQKEENFKRGSNAFMSKGRTCYKCGKEGHIQHDCKDGGQTQGRNYSWRSAQGNCQQGRPSSSRGNYIRGRGRNQRGTSAHQAEQHRQQNEDSCAWITRVDCNSTYNNDYSKIARVYTIKSKAEVYDSFGQYVNECENLTGKRVKILRCDNAKEYLSKNMYNFAREKGIIIKPCPPYGHQLNGVAESFNRRIMNLARCLLQEAQIHKKYWPEIVCAATYLKNRTFTNTVEKKTPYEIFFGRKPDVSNLKLYGNDENFEIDENSVNESLDETFESIGENSEIHDNENKLKIPKRFDIPYTFEEAINSEESKNWIKAMNKEIESLKSNNTWELIENTENKKVIDVKWVYNKKSDNIHKARLVVRGFQQKEEIDDIYAPVAKMQTLKILLSYCCRMGLIIEQMDVETAFLNVSKYGLENSKLYNTPMEVNLKIEKSDACEQNIKYRNLIGALLYISSATRPDISFAVNYLSRFQNSYNETHFKYALRILQYLYKTKYLSLTFKGGNNTETIDCYVDADWAGDNVDRKSTTGYVIRLFGNVIYWKSKKKQKSVTKASTFAEYVALSEAVSEIKFVRELLKIFEIECTKPINIYEDNSGAINIAKYGNFTKKSKHVEVHYHYVHEMVKENIINIIKVESNNNVADIFTTSLCKDKFEKFRSMLNLM
ncbi:unnamed protein product [Hermetia illucens]|uniref:Retrovirus-related Pol polyprotein from transposon TNT 1-94 n=1 Tax=Hermetia illucens TaxID=343691 RepID=A0A7R8V6R9_HERIL|nr:unnamed protein product [Hermetia illucens]